MPDSAPRIPLFDLEAQYRALREPIDAAIERVVPQIRFVLGPEVAELESALAEFTGARHAVSVANGTDALIISLLAEGIGSGDAVFVPAFTFVATAGAVVNVGATPVFVDVDERSFNMAPEALAAAIAVVEREGRLRPAAVIPVDLFGAPADYPALRSVTAAHGLRLIADAAQSIGAAIDDRRVGTLADLTATSFYPTKPLGGYGDGGCIFTDDDDCAERLRLIRTHGIDPASGEVVRPGLNSRLDTLQAAILLVKLQVFAEELAARQRIAERYAAGLHDVAVTPSPPATHRSAWAIYSILVDHRDRVRQALTDAGIGTGIYYSRALHLQPAYARYGDGPGSLPVTEALSTRILALPMSPYMDEGTVDAVCAAIAGAI